MGVAEGRPLLRFYSFTTLIASSFRLRLPSLPPLFPHCIRHYEAQDAIEDAIAFYSMSECYNNAIRLAKEHSMREQMLNLALKSTKVGSATFVFSCSHVSGMPALGIHPARVS